jgi:hypothetical protein
MPRGGRRPGAGAPRGNTNGLRNGKHCLRARFVVAALRTHPEQRALALALRDAGFLVRRSPNTPYVFTADIAGALRFLIPPAV